MRVWRMAWDHLLHHEVTGGHESREESTSSRLGLGLDLCALTDIIEGEGVWGTKVFDLRRGDDGNGGNE